MAMRGHRLGQWPRSAAHLNAVVDCTTVWCIDYDYLSGLTYADQVIKLQPSVTLQEIVEGFLVDVTCRILARDWTAPAVAALSSSMHDLRKQCYHVAPSDDCSRSELQFWCSSARTPAGACRSALP